MYAACCDFLFWTHDYQQNIKICNFYVAGTSGRCLLNWMTIKVLTKPSKKLTYNKSVIIKYFVISQIVRLYVHILCIFCMHINICVYLTWYSKKIYFQPTIFLTLFWTDADAHINAIKNICTYVCMPEVYM